MSLQEKLELVRARSHLTKEEEVKAFIVSPVLDSLGWPSNDPDHVSYEYTVSTKPAGRIDIALHGRNGTLAAFLELKAPGARLDDHLPQLLGYAFYAGARICVLTNGMEWRFYLPFAEGKPEQRCFCCLRLDYTGDQSPNADAVADNFRKYLSRHALLDGSAEKNAEAALRAVRDRRRLNRRLPEIWRQITDDPDPDLVVLIQKRVEEDTGIDVGPGPVKRTLAGEEPFPEDITPGAWSPDNTTRVPGTAPITGGKPVGFSLLGTQYAVKSNADIYIKIVEILYERQRGQFATANKRPPLSRWISTDGNRLRSPRRIAGSKYSLDVGMSVRQMAGRWSQFLKAFGYNPNDLWLHYHESSETSTAKKVLNDDDRTGRRPHGEHFRASKNVPGERPVGLRLFGREHSVKTNKDVLVKVAEILYRRHPNDFLLKAEKLWGSRRAWISRDPNIYHQSGLIGDSPYYINTKLNVRSMKWRWNQILKAFGYDPDDLELIYRR